MRKIQYNSNVIKPVLDWPTQLAGLKIGHLISMFK